MKLAIIQARMGSTRLPGKALVDIAGKPMLQRVVERTSLASGVRVVVATTNEPADDVIVDFCKSRDIPVHRGPEDDVLGRFVLAAEAEELADGDLVIRVTSDCPLIDPGIIDQVAAAVDGDYASNVMDPRTFPRGLDVEAFTVAALRRADREDRSAGREHVTPIMYQSGAFQCTPVVHSEDLSNHRWTVDTPEDLELVRAIYARIGTDDFTWTDVLREWQPAWTHINAGVQQKPT